VCRPDDDDLQPTRALCCTAHRAAATSCNSPRVFIPCTVGMLFAELGRKTYRTRDEVRADVLDYIERFYNPKRRHSTIGYLSPMEFEIGWD
jgi:transposase InsO family protein